MKQTLSSRCVLPRCALPRLGAESLLAINIPNVVATTIPSARLPPVRIAPKAARYSERYIRHMILAEAICPLARESAPPVLLLSSDSCGRGRSYL